MATLVVTALGLGCAAEGPDRVVDRAQPFDPPTELPSPDVRGDVPLEQVLDTRRSGRAFSSAPLPVATVGQLFWAAQGVTDAAGHRTAPSAGALYPLELYAVTASSLVHYLPNGHRIERRVDGVSMQRLSEAAFGQDFVGEAPIVFVVTAVVERTEAKYGAVAQAFVDREVGHAVQNLLLQATALGLHAAPVGGFDASEVAELLALPPGEVVTYLVPVGHPATDEGSDRR